MIVSCSSLVVCCSIPLALMFTPEYEACEDSIEGWILVLLFDLLE